MFDEYQDRVGELITGIVQQSDSRYTLVQLRERVEALLPRSEQVGGERYDHGARVKAIITDVSAQSKGPSIIVSRRSPELIRAAVRARGARDRRRPRRDPERGPRARLPLEDRRRLAHQRRRPGRRLRRPARLARADGRVRAARREDRHHPLQRGAGPLRGQGALARARARGAGGRRGQAGHGDRARRPALAGDRQGRPERAPGRPPDRLARGHPLGDRVRRGGADHGLRGGRGRRALRGDPRPTASAARTRRSRARATAACPRTRRWPTRRATTAGSRAEGRRAEASGAEEPAEPTGSAPRARGRGARRGGRACRGAGCRRRSRWPRRKRRPSDDSEGERVHG